MIRRALLLAAPFLAAAAPPQGGGLSLQVPAPSYPFSARTTAPAPQRQTGPVYEPAPLPNRNVLPPSRAESTGTEISPSLFNRHDANRGAALSTGDSEQGTQNRNLRPSPGFTLKMPLQPEGGVPQ